MLSISNIKNPYGRKTLLVLAAIPAFILSILIGSLVGCIQALADTTLAFKAAWKGIK